MSARLAVASLATTIVVALAACQSSGQYGGPSRAAGAVAFGVAGAAASRALGGCYAQCLPGTVCNPKNGLCERPELGKREVPVVGHPPRAVSAAYPAGYEYDVPPAIADAGCDPPPASGDAGPAVCEPDASVSSH